MFDGLGSERTVTNSSQSVTGTINLDAFGLTVNTTGSSTNPYKFAANSGYRDDGDAGLVHVGARYYDPQVGRFITRDTDLCEHPYAYCEHDPVNAVDPSGHQAEHTKNKSKGRNDKHTKVDAGDKEKGDKNRFKPKEKWRKPTPEKPTPQPKPEPWYRNVDWGEVGIITVKGIGIIVAPELTLPAVAIGARGFVH